MDKKTADVLPIQPWFDGVYFEVAEAGVPAAPASTPEAPAPEAPVTGPPNGFEIAQKYSARLEDALAAGDGAGEAHNAVSGGEEILDDGLDGYDVWRAAQGADIDLDPFDPSNPNYAENVYAELEAQQQQLAENVYAIAAQYGVDPAEIFQAMEIGRANQIAYQEQEAMRSELIAENATAVELLRFGDEFGPFDGDAAVETARNAFAAVQQQYGPEVAAQVAPDLLREAAKQEAEATVAAHRENASQFQIAGLLHPNADPIAAYSIAGDVFPHFVAEHDGDVDRGLMEAMDFANRSVAYAAAGGSQNVSGQQLASYYGARARQLERMNTQPMLDSLQGEQRRVAEQQQRQRRIASEIEANPHAGDPRNIGADIVRKYAAKNREAMKGAR